MRNQTPTQDDQDFLMEVLTASSVAEKAVAYHKRGKLDEVIEEVREECKSLRKAVELAWELHDSVSNTDERTLRDAVSAAVLFHEMTDKGEDKQ